MKNHGKHPQEVSLAYQEKIWQHLLYKQITITVEKLSSKLNVNADFNNSILRYRDKCRMDAFGKIFAQNLRGTGKTQSGLVSIENMPSASSVYDMDTRLEYYSNKFNTTWPEQKSQLCFSPYCIKKQILHKLILEEKDQLIIVTPIC